MADGEAEDLLPSGDRPPDHVLVDRERRAYLADAVLALPERLRAVVIGYFYEERPMLELAAELGVTESRVSQLRAEALILLRDGLNAHLEQTRGQIERLDQVFEQLDLPKRAKKCEGMEGLLEEARAAMEEIEDATVLDVGMIINAQKVEHYEIAGYGSLVALAKQLGHDEAAQLLDETLEEEKETDRKLNEVALTVANAGAGEQAKGGQRRAAARR